MQERFGLVTGLSDHTIDNTTAIASIGLGAAIIEKHVTLNRDAKGPDDSFSLEHNELKHLCKSAFKAWQSLGKINYEVKSSEKDNIKFRRSLYFVKNISKGEVITIDHVRSIRPGYGMAPKELKNIIGKKMLVNILRGSAVKSSDFS